MIKYHDKLELEVPGPPGWFLDLWHIKQSFLDLRNYI